MEDKERIEKGELLVKAIIELMGSPKEHVEKTLKEYTEKLKDKKDFTIVKEDYADAEEQKNKMFSAFVELDIWFKDTPAFLAFCFDSMPSSIDIMQPDGKMPLNSKDFSNIINDMLAKIHNLDLLVKSVRAQTKLLDHNATRVLRNFIIFLIEKEVTVLEGMSRHLGIKPKELKPFIDRLVKEGFIEEKEGKYSLKK